MPAVQTSLSLSLSRSLSPPAFTLSRRTALVFPVLVLHGALLWLLLQAQPQRRDRADDPSATRTVLLRWITPEAKVPVLQAPPAAETARREEKAPRPRAVSRAITSNAPPAPTAEFAYPQPAPMPVATTPATAETSQPTATPLDLRLPRGTTSSAAAKSPASLATQDRRANNERLNFGEKLAEALGSDGRRTEENLGDGRIRFRSGADCVEAHESRAGQLDPMSQTTRPAPRGAKACK
jgi:hypothetical protein